MQSSVSRPACCSPLRWKRSAPGGGRVFLNDYPPVVTAKLRELHLVAEKPPAKKSDILRKGIAMMVYALLFALVLHRFNGITTF